MKLNIQTSLGTTIGLEVTFISEIIAFVAKHERRDIAKLRIAHKGRMICSPPYSIVQEEAFEYFNEGDTVKVVELGSRT